MKGEYIVSLYQVFVTQTPHGFLATQKDFDIEIDAETIEQSLTGIKRQLLHQGIMLLKAGEELPPTNFRYETETTSCYIDVDIYQEFQNSATELVRRNITMPTWMDIRLRHYNVNASNLFQAAATKFLEEKDNVKYRPIETLEDLKNNISSSLLDDYVKESIQQKFNQ